MEYLITAYPSTPTPAMILTPPARAYSPSPSPSPEYEPVASTSKLPLPPARRVLDHILLPRLPAGWLGAPPTAGGVSEPVQDEKMCHQCRNQKNPHARYHCGRAGCVRAYCTSCLSKRYAWSPSDIHSRGCPGCRGVCNCSQCLDRAGLSAHKAFLTADARAGGCARKWLAERGLLVEGDGPPPTVAQRKKKNMVRRAKILAKPKTTAVEGVPKKKKVKKTQPRPVDYDDDDEEDEPRSRGRWIIDASAKLVKRWARERAARGDQVRAGTRRWFVGASPPPRARARDDAAPVETIDLTLDDDDDTPDSLFDAKSADGDAQSDDKAEDAGEKIADDVRAPDSPDSLFDEKTEDEDAPAQDDAADDKDDAPAPAPAQLAAPPSAQNDAPDDKDDDADSLFDGDPGTPAAAAPSPQILPAAIELPSTPPHLPSTLTQLPSALSQLPPTPIHLSITSSQLPPTPIQLPPASPIVPTHDSLSLSRSDSYTDALRIDVELAMPSSPAKGAVDVHITFGDAFASTASTSPSVARAPASPVTARAPVTVDSTAYAAPASPAATTDPSRAAPASPIAHPKSPLVSTGPAPAPPPKSPPKTFSKAASAMFIPRAKPVAKRKRDEDENGADATRLESAKTRLESAKSSAGVLVALGRPGRVQRVREDEPPGEDMADTPAKKDGAPVPTRKDDATVLDDDATNDKDDTPMQQDGALLKKDGAIAQKNGAPTQKRPREEDASRLDDERPAKRPALSKETARKPRAHSAGREDDYDVGDETRVDRAAPSKETARKHRADASIAHGSPALDDDEPPVGRAAPSKQTPRASSSRHEDSTIVDGLPTPKPTLTKQDAARPSAADALAQAMRAAYGGGASASFSNPTPAASSAPVASSSSAPVASSSSARAPASSTKRSKPTVLAQRASLAIALKAPAPSAASALAAAYKQAYAAARAPSPASTLRSSPTPEPLPPTLEQDKTTTTVRASKPALHDELSTFVGGFDDEDKPTPELLPSDLAAQSEGSSRTGPVSPVVAHRRPPTITINDDDTDEEMPQRRPFVPCNPRRFVGMPLRFVPAPKRPRQAVIDVDSDEDEDEQDFGLARRRKRTKLWEDSVVVQQQAHEPIVVLDDSDDSDFQPPVGKGKAKAKAKSFGPGKGKTKPPPRKLPLSSFIAYSYTPPPSIPEPEEPQEPVFVPDDDTAAAPPASEVWLGAAMAPLSPDLGLTRAVADAWFSAV